MAYQVIWGIDGKAEMVAEIERSLIELNTEIERTPGFVEAGLFQGRENPAQFCWLVRWNRRAEGEDGSRRMAEVLDEIDALLVEPAKRCTLEFLWEHGVQPGRVEATELVRLVMAPGTVESSLETFRQAGQSLVGRFGIVSLTLSRCVEYPDHLYVVQELERDDAADRFFQASERREWLGGLCDALETPPRRYRLKSHGWPNSTARV
jgi:heme-degrading monooxygenase HmoA